MPASHSYQHHHNLNIHIYVGRRPARASPGGLADVCTRVRTCTLTKLTSITSHTVTPHARTHARSAVARTPARRSLTGMVRRCRSDARGMDGNASSTLRCAHVICRRVCVCVSARPPPSFAHPCAKDASAAKTILPCLLWFD